ncbi:hypothetical protein BY454_1037 [Marinobacter persicus]|jgi:hypothetical protein|uniref:Uncharacterized protein n=1 Tax=Marinobacter persicus TaxID=930118 RepID=A0A2S6G9G7_9GAMM|nr:MAG: hypothetical protein AWU57_1717 [Marinobacter sp. T13-3]PPK52933.1 hypothetical protein BY455_1037 [Marinobacter persicus]PPK55810.1 hypothetical protein B0H24_10037 [Marinobacter persicus]PPK59405.1 hypothetical protein BY454_1037 [Marinobacter persicus]
MRTKSKSGRVFELPSDQEEPDINEPMLDFMNPAAK